MPSAEGNHRCAWIAAGAILVGALLLVTSLPAAVRAQTGSGYGTEVLAVNGSAATNVSLAEGGVYYLIVATDSGSSYVDARISYNASLVAQLNESGSAATLVSLAGGSYVMDLSGNGRAALGWDFTNGSVQAFPDNETVSGFLRPASAHIDVVVSMGDAQEIHLEVYDDRLLPVMETNVTTSRTLGVDLPESRGTFAFLRASVVSGNPQGAFGLAWSSPSPQTAGPDLGSQILTVFLWIAVPVVLALLAFVVLRRRRNRSP